MVASTLMFINPVISTILFLLGIAVLMLRNVYIPKEEVQEPVGISVQQVTSHSEHSYIKHDNAPTSLTTALPQDYVPKWESNEKQQMVVRMKLEITGVPILRFCFYMGRYISYLEDIEISSVILIKSTLHLFYILALVQQAFSFSVVMPFTLKAKMSCVMPKQKYSHFIACSKLREGVLFQLCEFQTPYVVGYITLPISVTNF